ncbi:hypothetical protein PILCRDRAFT_529082 [Piloderma croceum F 1598]|uniref:Uncharacterized protein n=1 Tax=Piloderma croceum (strain F 1598) TaxID=765440 RepID=A0A0C3FN34_PILCF|nr:hypothetical protein PILCRDRAFT_529082 [Piloderma croceum F 1598]
MTTLADMTPAIEGYEEQARICGLSFDWGTTDELQSATDFFDDLLAPAAIESYLNEAELSNSPAEATALGPLSSPLSTRSDIGAFFDWSVAASKDEHQVSRTRRMENTWLSPGNHFGLAASRSVTMLSCSRPSTSPSAGKFDVRNELHHARHSPNHDLRAQQNESLASTAPSLLVSGWSPPDGSFDMVDLHPPKCDEVHRTPLADMTVAWNNHAILVYGLPVQPSIHPYSEAEIPKATYAPRVANSVAPVAMSNARAAVTLPQARNSRPHSKRSSQTPVPIAGADIFSPLYPDAVLRLSAQGRPVGGVPPALARSVTASMIKKEHDKTRATIDAKRSNINSRKSSNYVASVLQQPEDSNLQVIKERNTTAPSSHAAVSVLQEVSGMHGIDYARDKEVGARMKEASPGFLDDDLILANHTLTADRGTPSIASDEDVQLRSFAYTFALKHDQDTALPCEMRDLGYFWPIGQRVKRTKRGLDSGVENSCAMKKSKF